MNLLAQLFGSSVPGIDPGQAQARLSQSASSTGGANARPFLLDVRQPEEFRAGHIGGATLIPLHELPRRMAELPRDCEIICVCRSGNRSHSAASQLKTAGYNAVNLQGGMVAWSRLGLPVKKGSAR